MHRILSLFIVSLLFVALQTTAKADDYVVPAGTLLRCTLDEPNFSSATADIGDPVICHLSGLSVFGHNVLPRGSYLGGHLESAKEPGRFWGKGNLKIEFDRIGFPSSDVPVPSKVIAAKGYKVDKHGDILGKGHATRDTIEWLLPPLWPWKILTLPARGPRPALKGEEQITVRLMDDIEVPRVGAAYHSYDRPPASYHSQSFQKPASYEKQQWAAAETMLIPTMAQDQESSVAPSKGQPAARLKLIALKSNKVYAVTQYRTDNGSVSFVLASGATGSVDMTEVNWRATSRLNAESVALAAGTSY